MAVREIIRGVLLITLLDLTRGKLRARVRRLATRRPPRRFHCQSGWSSAKWNRRDTPGCAVGIVHRGQVIYRKGFGSANLEYQVPNTPQTVFEVTAVSQSLTCVCLAMLMDEGKISPEDDLRKFVPEMHPFDPPIRIQDMVRCRTGLWDLDRGAGPRRRGECSPSISLYPTFRTSARNIFEFPSVPRSGVVGPPHVQQPEDPTLQPAQLRGEDHRRAPAR